MDVIRKDKLLELNELEDELKQIIASYDLNAIENIYVILRVLEDLRQNLYEKVWDIK